MAQSNILAGISFPFRKQNNGQPAPEFGVDVVRSDLIALLRTKKRSRVNRPDIGTNLHQLLFEDQGPILQTLVLREIVTSVAAQLPLVEIKNIQFQEDPANGKILHVNVQYSVQGIEDQTGFVAIPKG